MAARFAGKTVTLGVCGGIAAYKMIEVARRLAQDGTKVPVIFTRSALNFVTPLSFRTFTGETVASEQFDPGLSAPMQHLAASWDSDVIVVAPATANVIAKLANGVADDLLTTTVLAAKSPVIVVPSMNERMYLNPATQRNVAALVERGVRIAGPTRGKLASGHEGWGRMVDIEEILTLVERELTRTNELAGKHVLITAGPTHEPVDAVRYLANRSSGKMGFAVADEALRRGAEVTLVSGPVSLLPPPGAQVIQVQTAAEMETEVLSRTAESDIVVMAAAIADVRAKSPLSGKVKKDRLGGPIELEQTADILARVVEGRRAGQLIVGFAAETENLSVEARRKRDEKDLDLVIANDVSRSDIGFGSDYNEVLLVFRDRTEETLSRKSKRELAVELWDRIAHLLD